jgi:fructokinase
MSPIVGIGEVLWDIYPDGRKVAGGAPFNFAFHCHQLGHEAVIVSRVGNDDLGRELREEVRRLGLTDDFIQTDREHPTGTVRVTLDHNKVPSYTIADDVAWDYIMDEMGTLGSDIQAICFGTLAQREFRNQAVFRSFLERVAVTRPGALRVFDCNIRQQYYSVGVIDASVTIANWIKMSAEDVVPLLGIFDDSDYWYEGYLPVAPLSQRYRNAEFDLICLTRGENGCMVLKTGKPQEYRLESERCRRWNDASEEIIEPGIPANVVDTVGAGDAFTAAMVCLHLEARPLRDCARFANHYAARVCEFQGATPRIDRAEVERAAFGS